MTNRYRRPIQTKKNARWESERFFYIVTEGIRRVSKKEVRLG